MSSIAQTAQQSITVTENIAYRTDVGPSTVLDMATPQFGPQKNRPAILIIHGGHPHHPWRRMECRVKE